MPDYSGWQVVSSDAKPDYSGWQVVDSSAEPSAAPKSVFDKLSSAITNAIQSTANVTAKSPGLSRALQGAGAGAGTFNRWIEATPVPGISHGIVQGWSDLSSSIANAPLEVMDAATGSQTAGQAPDLSQYGQGQDPYARGAGYLLSQLAGGGGVAKAAESQIPKAASLMGKLGRGGAIGAGTGALTGENLPGGRAFGALVGGPAGVVTEGVSSLLGDLGDVRAVKSKVAQNDKLIEDLTQGKTGDADAITGAQEDAANILGDASKSAGQKLSQSATDIKKLLGGNSLEDARTRVSQVIAKAKEATRIHFQKAYQMFNKSAPGSKKIANVLGQESLRGLDESDLGQAAMEKLPQLISGLGEDVHGPVNPATGLSQLVSSKSMPAPTVGEYVNFDRDLRDQAWAHRNSASSPTSILTKFEKDAAMAKADKIDALRQDVQASYKNVLNPQEIKQLETLNSQYSKIAIPFKQNSFIRNAAKGKVTGSNITKTLAQENSSAWNEYMRQAPWGKEFTDAIAKHDLQDLNINKASALGDALSGDMSKNLSAPMARALTKHLNNLNDKQTIDSLRKYIGKSELAKTVNAPELNDLISRRRNLAAPLANISKARQVAAMNARNLEAAKQQQAQLKQQLEKYKTSEAVKKGIAPTLAAFAGLDALFHKFGIYL